MDKKNNYRSNPTCSTTKSVVSESRKNQDATGGKQWPRNGRRRESTNFSANSKPEPTRPRQTTNFDKRFRTRGDGYQRSVGPTTTLLPSSSARLDDDTQVFEAELNSVYIPGSKKQNLNHLLNFNYAPRDHNDAMTFASFRSQAGHNHHHYRTNNYLKKTKYNKEQFLQATCQFVVNANYDYDAYTMCPDTLVDWNHVEQVIVQTAAEEPQCPICLFPPVAGKMTRCGHIYCWPCLLQYLSLSDKPWRKCPICYDAVHIEHLKSVISKPYPIYNVDDVVTMQLMCREKTSLIVSKVTADQRRRRLSTNIPHLFDDADELQHTKLILADSNEIMTIIDRENNELIQQLMADGIDCPESIFIRQALELLSERDNLLKSSNKIQKIKIKEHTNSSSSSSDIDTQLDKLKLNIEAKPFVPNNNSSNNEMIDVDAENGDGEKNGAASATNNFVIDEETNLTLHDIDIQSMSNDSNLFYFYQATDGQHLYLKSINIRMLQMMYGGLDKAPRTITGKIVQKESCSMTEDLRKRLKYLQHLPVTSQFDVVEIVLDQPIVSAEVLAKFKDELAHRQKQRQRRAREERQREKHINEVNDRQIGKILSRSANIDMTSNRHFPMCGGSYDSSSPTFNNFDDHPPLQLSESGSNNSFASATSMPSTVSAAAVAVKSSQPAVTGPSFARMLTTAGQANVELWPSLGPTKGFTIEPMNGVKSEKSLNNVTNKELLEIFDDDDDELARAPEFKSSFGTAIAEALNKSTGKNRQFSSINSEMATSNGGGGKQKKKNKKTILFSTSARPF